MARRDNRSSHALARAGTSLRGLRAGWRRERALRELWFFLGGGWLLLLALGTGPVWCGIAAIATAASLAIEHLNTAIEVLLDRLHPESDPAVGTAKDLASGAALLCNLTAGAVILAAALVG